jgi:hypothetical protein
MFIINSFAVFVMTIFAFEGDKVHFSFEIF